MNDVVLIKDEQSDRNQWKTGIITDVIVGKDGNIRSCKVKTIYNELHRPIQKLILLIENEE